jgi:ATP-dependent DNA ligase
MLAQEYKQELISDSEIYNISQKLDGARYNIHLSKGKVEIVGRHSDKPHNYKYPEIMEEAIQLVSDEEITLDGEMVVSTNNGIWEMTNFNALASREHTENRKQIQLLSRMLPARFIVFDIITKDTIKLPLKERMEILQNYFGQYPNLRHIKPIYNINGDMKLTTKLFQQAYDLGLEGIMIKKLDSLYEDKRSDSWIKKKCYKEADEKIIGYTSKARNISALILESGSKVNAIIDDYWQDYILKQDISIIKESTEEVQKYFSKPSLTAVIKYLERTDNNIMRFPILKEIRV